jgi:hypothetical protein
MFGFMLFLHLAGLFVWLGSLFAEIVMLLILKKQMGSPESNALTERIIRIFSRFAHPSAFIVLASGVFLIIQLGMGSGKPFWLQAMEKGGGTIILLALICTGILGSKAKKQLRSGQGWNKKLSGYVTAMSSFMVLAMLILLIVSMKI